MINELARVISADIVVLIVAALPVIELRGAIPIGISLGLTPLESAAMSYFGSLIPFPFVFFLVKPLFDKLRGNRLFAHHINRLTDKSLKKGEKIQKYGFFGLILLVAIPLPGTGVWTGSMVASLLNIRLKNAFLAVVIGNLIACIIIMSLSNSIYKIVT